MNKTIAICTPSRERSIRFEQMYKSIKSTANRAHEVKCILRVDDDDPDLAYYQNCVGSNEHLIIGPHNAFLPVIINDCYRKFPCYDIYGFISDDMLFETKGWDDILLQTVAKMPYSAGCIFPANGQPEPYSYGDSVFLTKTWIESLGYALPEYFAHNEGDGWLLAIFYKIRDLGYTDQCVVLRDIIVRHLHRIFDASLNDATYRLSDTRRATYNPAAEYQKRIEENRTEYLKVLATYEREANDRK